MYILPAILAFILIVIDQVTKYIALVHLKPIFTTKFISGLLDFTFVENRGVAFGMFSGQKWFILVLTISIVIGLIWYYLTLPKTAEYRFVRLSMVLIFAGAIGNMIDRIFRGYVVDFFEFAFVDFPVFNMADIYVVVGVCILAFMILFVIKEPEKEPKNELENVTNKEAGE